MIPIRKDILTRTTYGDGRPLPKDTIARRKLAASIIREHDGAILNTQVEALIRKKGGRGIDKSDLNSIRVALGYKPSERGGHTVRALAQKRAKAAPQAAVERRVALDRGSAPVDGTLAHALVHLTEAHGIEELHYRIDGPVARLRVVQKITRDLTVPLSGTPEVKRNGKA